MDAARLAWAMFRRDMAVAMSYRAGFALTLGGAVANILGIYFLSSAVGSAVTGPIQRYGGSYFTFALVGTAFASFMAVGLAGTASRIREGQMMGTLELMLLSPNRLGLLLFGSSLWSHALAAVTLAVYLVVGVALGVDLSHVNIPMAVAALILSVIAFNALGLLAASVVIVIKQGNPVSLLVGTASVLLSGVLYPVSVLPGWLQTIAQLFPLTHALELMRGSILLGEGIETLWRPLLTLSFLTAILLPLGLWACARAIRIAQTDGSLAQY